MLSLFLSHGLWLALFAAAFAPTVAWLWDRWTFNVFYNGHGIFVPLIVAYLVRENFVRDPIREPDHSAWGFAALVLGLAMLVLDTSIKTELLSATGLVVCLPGLALLLLGMKRTRALLFPLLISFFMLPVPAGAISGVHLAMRHAAAFGSEHLIRFYGIPLIREGTTLHLPHSVVEIADACSGVSTLIASLLLSLILSYRARSWRHCGGLVGAALLLAAGTNTLRVSALILIVHYWGVDPLRTALHEATGMVSFVIVICALFWIERAGLRQPAGQ